MFRIETAQVAGNIVIVDCYITPALDLYADAPTQERIFGEIQVQDGEGRYSPYFMQVGLQRILYSALSPHSKAGVARAIPLLRGLIEALLALTFTLFAAVVSKEFGYLCAGLTASMLALSNWLIVFAPDLFWICFTFFAPFVLGFLLGDPARPVGQRRLLAVLFTFFCLLKCLCGFDYTTNIFAAVAVPFLYYGLRRGMTLGRIAARVAGYGALSIGAFCLAILLQMMQFAFVERNENGSMAAFLKEVHRRTLSNGEGLRNGYDSAVLAVLHRLHVSSAYDGRLEHFLVPLRPVLRYFRYLSMGALTVPLPIHALTIPIGVFVACFVIVFWRQRKQLRSAALRGGTDRVTAWMWSTLAALAISHLWVVAANGHMTHTFFNAIVFYIPFLPMVYVGASFAVASLLRRAVLKYREAGDRPGPFPR